MVRIAIQRLSIWLIMPFVIPVYAHAQQVSSIEKASHIIRGTVEKTEPEMAGGLVPITNVFIRVDSIFKNSDDNLQKNQVIKILLYGIDNGQSVLTTPDKELVFLAPGHQVIIPLKKWYEHYKLFDREDDPFALAYVNGGTAAGYDASTVKNFAKKKKLSLSEEYYNRQQHRFQAHETARKQQIERILSTDAQSRAYGSAKYDNVSEYEGMLAQKADFCSINSGRRAPIVARVKITSVTATKDGVEIGIDVLKKIKGQISLGGKKMMLPLAEDMRVRGWPVPKNGSTGIVLLSHDLTPAGFPDYFIEEKQGAFQMGRQGKLTLPEFTQMLMGGN